MIKKLTIKGFKGQDGTFEFGPNLNKIKGPNEAGKSTIKDAINFVFWGTDAEFSNSTDHLITNGQESCEVILQTEKSTLARRKRRGDTSQFKASLGGAPFIEMTQKDLEERVLQMDRDVFTSCWLAGHFMSLSGEGRMQLFSKLAKLDRRELLASRLPPGTVIPPKVKLEELAVDIAVLQTERRNIQNIIKSDTGALREVEARLSELSSVPDVEEGALIEEKNTFEAYQELLNKYEQNLAKFEAYQVQESEKSARVEAKTKTKADLLSEREALIAQASKLADQRDAMTKTAQASSDLISELRKSFLPIPAAPEKPSVRVGVCPTCNQAVSETHIHGVMGDYEKRLMSYNEECSQISQKNVKIQSQIDEESKTLETLLSTLKNVELAIRDCEHKITRAEVEVSGIDQELQAIKKARKVPAPAKPEIPLTLEQVQQKLVEVSTLLSQSRQKKAHFEAQKERFNLLSSSIASKEEVAKNLYQIEKALEYLPTLEAEVLTKSLSLPGGKIALNKFQRKVNGQMVDRGELLVFDEEGVDYRSLSSGRKLRMDVEICHKIRELAGARAPRLLFVDNKDLMDRDVRQVKGIQTMVAEVDGNLDALNVVVVE